MKYLNMLLGLFINNEEKPEDVLIYRASKKRRKKVRYFASPLFYNPEENCEDEHNNITQLKAISIK